MRRRKFIGLAGGAVAAGLVPRAGQARPISGLGFLGLPAADSLPKRTEGFRAGLRDLGYHEGRDLVVEYRWADNAYDRLPALLAELIDLKVDVIVTHGTPGAMAAKRATSTIPIVIAVVGDAVASGLVASLSRPGGNITGLTFFQPELNAKRLELLKEAVPDLMDVGVLLNPDNQMNRARIASSPEGRQAGRLAGRAGDPVPDHSQSRDRQGTRPGCVAVAAAARRRGDRIGGGSFSARLDRPAADQKFLHSFQHQFAALVEYGAAQGDRAGGAAGC